MPDYRETLRRIRTFPSLIKFLQEELDWPIISGDFEELTFDYTPEELGIDTANAAKIQEIKRLRPLEVNQPWGIFFVMFEPKRLPVVALRRILSRVVLKKRASANRAESAAWQADDLLFVSNYGGEGEERQISFAHFAQHGQKNDLPTLKVLGWDNLDTPLHLDHVADMLVGKLFWPDDPDDLEKWRKTWRSAFTLRHGEVINTSKDLAVRLAELARAIRDRIKTVLAIETANGPLTKLMKAFKQALVHDLDADGFADMYAQTIAYGLLSARVENPQGKTADDLAAQMTNPFLKELMETFLHVGGRKGKASNGNGIDFDELGVSEVVELLDTANMEAVVRDFGDLKPEEDPVIHFYELFLKEYDPHEKVKRGIFYTPRPVVSYIVRSVDELLRTELGLADGLAATVTWGEMAERHLGFKIPQGTKPDEPFVQILDPATGTGTFLVEVIDLIHKTMVENWQTAGHNTREIRRLWNSYVSRHLLPRLYGYELLMAPYAIAHMKIGLKLYETGYRFASDERIRVFLTNALEPAQDFSGKLAFMIPALAHEAQAVNSIKLHQRFTVVIGNPPYSSAAGSTRNDFISALMKSYTEGLGVEDERKKGALQDDYIRFIALSHQTLRLSPIGVIGLITNNSYLDGTLHRAMRHSLSATSKVMMILNLHGSSRAGAHDTGADENVFDIMQGVAVLVGVFVGGDENKSLRTSQIQYAELLGSRAIKYHALVKHYASYQAIQPTMPYFLFRPLDTSLFNEYESFLSLQDAFIIYSSGIETEKDHFAVDFDAASLEKRLNTFCDLSLGSNEIASRFGLKDTPNWSMAQSRRALSKAGLNPALFVRYLYHCFDWRYTYYSDLLITRSRKPVMRHMIGGNLAIVCLRQVKGESWAHAFVSSDITNKFTLSSKSSNVSYHFPLFILAPDSHTLELLDRNVGSILNLQPKCIQRFAGALGKPTVSVDPRALSADVMSYFYALLYSIQFRARYSEYLRLDFPRLPITSSPELFRALARLGGELVALHLVEAPVQQALSARYDQRAKAWCYDLTPGHRLPVALTFTGPAAPIVEKVGWSDDTVWLDAAATKKGHPAMAGTIGFRGVPEAVWNFHIGGYQVCQKWLKDRKGRTLSADDLTHYHRIVIALHETIRLMKEIDEVIDQHGGWPGAFTDSTLHRN